jgi:hypothetical protein
MPILLWADSESETQRMSAMKIAYFLPLLAILPLLDTAYAQLPAAPALPYDTPQTMRTTEAVCTGVGSDARSDPRWASYPLKIEIAGSQGQFLGEAEVSVNKGEDAIVSVRCGGPWVLFRLDPGAYSVSAMVGGATVSSRVNVSGRSQARVILRFPDQGGAVSPEYEPKL